MVTDQGNNIDLASLAVAVQDGDLTLKDELFAKLLHYVTPVIRYKLGTNTAALDDITGVVMEAVWKNFYTWDRELAAFPTWVSTIVNYKVIDHFRKIEVETRHVSEIDFDDIGTFSAMVKDTSDNSLPVDVVQAKESEHLVLTTLLKDIEDIDRLIYLLRLNYDLSFQELSKVMQTAGKDLSVRAVEGRFYRTREKLKQALAEQAPSLQ